MTLPGTDPRYRYFVAIYRCDVVTTGPFSIACEGAKVELFRDERTYFPNVYRNGVIPTVLDGEYCFPAHPPIALDTRCQHLVITTRTKAGRAAAQPHCEAIIDQVVGSMAAVLSPDLFRTLLFRGWLSGGPPDRDLGLLLKAVSPIEVDHKQLALALTKVLTAAARHATARDRLPLMARFIAKGISEPPSEEAFVWLWTALEIFPMVDTTDIRPIGTFLAPYLGLDPKVVKEKLRIGWLFGLRSKIVHDGHLPLDRDSQFSALSNLELVVTAVVRHTVGLSYDGALDHLLQQR